MRAKPRAARWVFSNSAANVLRRIKYYTGCWCNRHRRARRGRIAPATPRFHQQQRAPARRQRASMFCV
eukprot:8749227-Lingulodinium_polyedra.AAC.1